MSPSVSSALGGAPIRKAQSAGQNPLIRASGERPRGKASAGQDDDALRALSTRIPDSLHRRLKIAAVMRGLTVQEGVHEAIEEWLAAHEHEA